MNRSSLVILTGIIAIFLGFVIGKAKYDKPPKIIEKEVKVYDFSQDERIMKIYANTLGYELVDKENNGAYKHGWEDGYNKGRGG